MNRKVQDVFTWIGAICSVAMTLAFCMNLAHPEFFPSLLQEKSAAPMVDMREFQSTYEPQAFEIEVPLKKAQ